MAFIIHICQDSSVKVLCGRAAALFAGGDFGDYQNVRAITEPDGGVKKFLYVLWGGTTVL